VLPKLNIRAVMVSMNLLWVKRRVIRRQKSSYLTPSNVELSHDKRPDSVVEAQNTFSTSEYEFIVGQTPSYWPSNVQLSHAKRPGSVAEGQRTCSTSEDGLIVRQTPS